VDTSTSASVREQALLLRFGELLTIEDIRAVFKYPSTDAVWKAHKRGTLPVKLAQFPRRRGWFTTAKAVAAALDDLDQ